MEFATVIKEGDEVIYSVLSDSEVESLLKEADIKITQEEEEGK